MADKTREIDLSRPVRLADLPALGYAAFEWWISELAEALPARARALLPRRRPAATVVVNHDSWRIRRETDDGLVECAFDPAQDTAARADALTPLLATSHDITVLIPAAEALVRRVQLPMLTDARVRPAIELQIDRLTPFKAEDVRLACRVAERRIEQNDMSVDVVVVPRQTLAAIEQQLSSFGLRADVIDIASGVRDQGKGFDLREAQADAASHRYRLMNVGLAAAAAFVWLMAYYAHGAAGEAEIERWQARIDEARLQAQRSSELARQIDGMTQPLEVARLHDSESALAVLKELTRLLPDTARLFQLRVSGDTVEASGVAPNAPALIALLERSKMFADVRFRAPLTRAPNSADDRFDMTMKLERGGP